jgi:DNA mismatch repair protein MutS
VHVAQLAGVPAQVVRRAASLMATMEKHGGPLGKSASLQALPLFAASPDHAPEPEEVDAVEAEYARLCDALNEINPDELSPKQALDALYRLKALAPGCAAADK